MEKTIKLKFIIIAHYSKEPHDLYYNYENSYNENIKLKQVLCDIRAKYGRKQDCIHYDALFDNLSQLWKPYMLCEHSYMETDLKDYTLKELKQLFDIENFLFFVKVCPGMGDCLGQIRKIKFIIHSETTKQHHTPHIHIESSGEIVRINLETLEFMDGIKFKEKRKNIIAYENVKLNQEGLLRYWGVAKNGARIPDYKMVMID